MQFDPFKIQLGVSNDEILVDGAIIAENPSLYSVYYQKELKKYKEGIRVVSIGSGSDTFEGVSFKSGKFIKTVLNDADMVISLFNYIKATTHAYWAKLLIGADNYHEFDFQQPNIDSYDGSHMPTIKEWGVNLLAREKTHLTAVVKELVDQWALPKP